MSKAYATLELSRRQARSLLSLLYGHNDPEGDDRDRDCHRLLVQLEDQCSTHLVNLARRF